MQRASSLEPLRTPTATHVTLEGTRLDPTSPMRLHFHDGGQTRWLHPETLRVTESGLFRHEVELRDDRPLSLTVRHVLPESLEPLRATAPPLELTVDDEGVVRVTGPTSLVADWLTRVRLGRGAEETWHFHWAPDEAAVMPDLHVTGPQLQAGFSLPRVAVDGVTWAEVAWLEVEHPDHGLGLAALLSAPLLLVVGGLTSSMDFFQTPTSASESDTADPSSPFALWKPGRAMPDTQGARSLFTRLAQRRARYLWTAGADLGTGLVGQRASQLSAFGGLQFLHFYDVAIGFRAWWPALLGSGVSLGPLQPSYAATMPIGFIFGRLGATFTLDADRRLSVPLHVEVGGSPFPAAQVRLSWGVQVRVTSTLSVALKPYTPVWTSSALGDGWDAPTTLELGWSY